MVRWNLSHCALSLSVAAVSLAACGGSQPPISAPGTPERLFLTESNGAVGNGR
jgi:hypothetical protein